jgi:hypothetical protein
MTAIGGEAGTQEILYDSQTQTGSFNPERSFKLLEKLYGEGRESAKSGHADYKPFCYLTEKTQLRRYLPGIMMCAAVVPANINQGR